MRIITIVFILGLLYTGCNNSKSESSYLVEFDRGHKAFEEREFEQSEFHYYQALKYSKTKEDSITVYSNIFTLYYVQKDRLLDALEVLDIVSCCLGYDEKEFNEIYYRGMIAHDMGNYEKSLGFLSKSKQHLIENGHSKNWNRMDEIDHYICKNLAMLNRVEQLEEFYFNQCSVEAKSFSVNLEGEILMLDSLFPGKGVSI